MSRLTKRYLERQMFIDKYRSLKFTRFDPGIAAGKLGNDWKIPRYKINITCEYIKPLYEKYKKIVSPGINTITDAQRYDFECIIMQIALMDMPPEDKISAADKQINNIKNNTHDYVPYSFNENCKYPIRAIGTIYQGNIKIAE